MGCEWRPFCVLVHKPDLPVLRGDIESSEHGSSCCQYRVAKFGQCLQYVSTVVPSLSSVPDYVAAVAPPSPLGPFLDIVNTVASFTPFGSYVNIAVTVLKKVTDEDTDAAKVTQLTPSYVAPSAVKFAETMSYEDRSALAARMTQRKQAMKTGIANVSAESRDPFSNAIRLCS